MDILVVDATVVAVLVVVTGAEDEGIFVVVMGTVLLEVAFGIATTDTVTVYIPRDAYSE